MQQLTLKKNSNLGESSVSITVLINQEDIDKFKLPPDWLGKEITLRPREWERHTGKSFKDIGGLKRKDIEEVAKGAEPRDPHAIVGLRKFVNKGSYKKSPKVDIAPSMSKFLYSK